jgi:hypothetical protein
MSHIFASKNDYENGVIGINSSLCLPTHFQNLPVVFSALPNPIVMTGMELRNLLPLILPNWRQQIGCMG